SQLPPHSRSQLLHRLRVGLPIANSGVVHTRCHKLILQPLDQRSARAVPFDLPYVVATFRFSNEVDPVAACILDRTENLMALLLQRMGRGSFCDLTNLTGCELLGSLAASPD